MTQLGNTSNVLQSWTQFGNLAKKDNIESVIGRGNIFSEKYQMSLKLGGLSLYSLHNSLLSFNNESSRRQILFGDRFMA